jgi:hypothetical protein
MDGREWANNSRKIPAMRRGVISEQMAVSRLK